MIDVCTEIPSIIVVLKCWEVLKMKRTLPEKIVCTVVYNGLPVEGITLKTVLKTDFKNDFSFLLGPTGKDGKAELNRDRILYNAAEELKLALMDFKPIAECFAGEILLHIMTEAELKAAMEAYELYKKVSFYPQGYKKILQNSLDTLNKVVRGNLELKAYVIPDTIKIVIE